MARYELLCDVRTSAEQIAKFPSPTTISIVESGSDPTPSISEQNMNPNPAKRIIILLSGISTLDLAKSCRQSPNYSSRIRKGTNAAPASSEKYESGTDQPQGENR